MFYTDKAKKTFNSFIILFVFGITGTTTAFMAGLIMSAVGAEPWTVVYIIGYGLFVFPLYNGLLLIYAFIFGKFDFFYSKHKEIIRRLTALFKKPDSKKHPPIDRD